MYRTHLTGSPRKKNILSPPLLWSFCLHKCMVSGSNLMKPNELTIALVPRCITTVPGQSETRLLVYILPYSFVNFSIRITRSHILVAILWWWNTKFKFSDKLSKKISIRSLFSPLFFSTTEGKFFFVHLTNLRSHSIAEEGWGRNWNRDWIWRNLM